jgi:FlaA1/EpsC-like NDP-sugar epimerase
MIEAVRGGGIASVRNRWFLLADVVLMGLAGVASFLLRVEAGGLGRYGRTVVVYGALSGVVKPAVFYAFGIYGHHWAYAGTRELLKLWGAALVGPLVTAGLAAMAAASGAMGARVPRSVPAIDWMVSFLFAGGARFFVRAVVRRRIWFPFDDEDDPLKCEPAGETRVVVMGAGDAGEIIVREMQENPGLGLVPVGFLDDDASKTGLRIHGVPVLGTREDIPQLAAEGGIDEVIIAMPTAPGKAIRRVVEICREAGVRCETMPGIYELISGQVGVNQIREVQIDDLLRRDPVQIGGGGARRLVAGARVMVTGAGGSIGSELCRQIASHGPETLILLDHGENQVYRIRQELAGAYPGVELAPVVADVRHGACLARVFGRWEPEIVFHAAAYKHVPLMECNRAEAVTNNVLGTETLLEAAEAHGVGRFVLISTDKAVNPVNVMGATKRAAELLVQAAAERTGRAYVAVRFGNVLGSRGSVVPLFQEQIAAGGPVTVTHPEMERFFMTIPEAVQLVLQAAALGEGGEIFVLDMGEQVRIVELAEQLIRLSGLEPGEDVEIAFTEPRPGEKLSEELFAAGEEPTRTKHEKILVANENGHRAAVDGAFRERVRELRVVAEDGVGERLVEVLGEIVPDYRPDGMQGLWDAD